MWGWCAGRHIIFLAPRAISRMMFPGPFGGSSLQTTTATAHLKNQVPPKRVPLPEVGEGAPEAMEWIR